MPENDLFREISSLETEKRNPRSENIDAAPTEEILRIINEEDKLVPYAVEQVIPEIALAVDNISERFKKGGRLIYAGAGTSGRLGIVDASECPPTFGSDPKMVQGLIAGGKNAVFKAREGAEDIPENGAKEIRNLNVAESDSVCGIAASGRTPFVKGALAEAKKRRAFTIMVCTVPKEKAIKMGIEADVFICPVVGPEVISGSTRMKSGTAQKLVLNMLTTASMVKLGKTLGNIMVDLQQTNKKLKERSKKILMTLTGISYDEAEKYLKESGGHVKTALVMILGGASSEKAIEFLEKSGGFVRNAIELAKNS